MAIFQFLSLIYIYIYMCVCVCICVCLFVYIGGMGKGVCFFTGLLASQCHASLLVLLLPFTI